MLRLVIESSMGFLLSGLICLVILIWWLWVMVM